MHYILKSALLLLLFVACSPKNTDLKQTPSTENNVPQDSPEISLDTFIYFSKGACFGQCPVYNFRISSTGYISYTGEMFVDKTGSYRGQLNSNEMNMLQTKIDSIDYFNLSEHYPVNKRYFIPDLPSTTTEIHMQGHKHSVFNNNGAPNALLEFETFLSDLVMKHVSLIKNDD